MKSVGERSMRGQIEVLGGNGRQTLLVEDGLINVGYRVRSFDVWPADSVTPNPIQYQAVLTMALLGTPVSMDASDNRQIGWSFMTANGAPVSTPATMYSSFIDPDHIAVRDLFVQLTSITDQVFNYLLVIEKVELSDDEAIIQIIKEESQSLP
tara:strand:+ start:807 stop:1265 length:459 start_codon:yes stop_codon:yes gene_type:complete